MGNKKASSTITFRQLSSSSDFLNLILDNISGCVLLLDNQMKLHAFNNSLKTIFSNKEDEHLLYQRCGEAIGCAYSVDEMKECGNTSHCNSCSLRVSAMEAYISHNSIYKKTVTRDFYKTTGVKENKHLQFSVHPFNFDNEYYIVLFIEDISNLKQSN